MLQKWKLIINNWINCYFNENNQDDRTVNIETLLNIISHLHENLNLDESKSSILEAHTVEGFLVEKYPEFKFENGTVESSNEDDVYLVASLLLFFVCVNSKDVDIKSAMCSKLSGDDQEIILKFTKSLLDCSPITLRDLQAAITEACGPEVASGPMKVAETPPALRSLHGEVRRLQAALDAERFDRNYLQEELARTNLRLEKLMKDKEQYKLDIVNLKAKISMCCGEDQDQRGTEAEAESSGKLQRQLQDMEERLVRTQELLDDVTYERDTYKAKMEELKQDRDKWLSLSQQESERAIQLGEELEVERRHMQALKELVNELRQHNRRNGLDTSLLECDDPDASIQSLQHNLSVCSEACANVVEVQLGEERAKVDALKQQLQRLQEDMHELNQKADHEKENFEKLLSERDNEIVNLKCHFNETVEKKDKEITEYYNEVVKLNNDNNELERRIKHNSEHSRQVIEQKIQEIETLQEQKLSLLQSLSDETTKLENIIAGLRSELEAEKQARAKMRDSYDNQMMKLNEKILNRNNELVELQNNVFEKSEMIETLQMNLRNEKELSNKYNMNARQLSEQKREVENKLQDKNEEMNAMQHSLEQNIASILKEIEHFKVLVASLQEHCRDLEESKSQLEGEIKRFEELLKDTENIKNAFSEATEKLKCELDEKNAIINTLQTHLQDEIRHKVGYQEELQRLQTAKMYMADDLNKLNVEYSKLKIELTGKDRTVESLEMSLQEARDAVDKLKADNEKLNLDLMKMSDEIAHKNKDIETLETTKKSLEDELLERNETIDSINHKIANLTSNKQALQNKIDSMNAEKTKLDAELVTKSKQISQLQAECEKLTKTVDENKKAIRSLDQNMTKEKHKYAALEKTYDSETSKLMGKLNENEKTIKELTSTSKKTIKNKEHQIQILTSELENLKKAMEADKESINLVDKEKEALIKKLEEEISYKNKIEKEYQNQCAQIESITSQLNEELTSKNNAILALTSELDNVKKTIEGKCKEIRLLGERLSKEDQLIRDLAHQKTVEAKDFQKKINDLQTQNNDLKQEVKKANECKEQAIAALQKENEQLQFAMEEDNSSREVILKEKDCIIDRLERQLKVHTDQLESIRKDYENITLTWEMYKVETKENMQAKEDQIKTLSQEATQLQENISELKREKEELVKSLQVFAEQIEVSNTNHNELVNNLVKELNNEETKLAAVVEEKQALQNQLVEEKAARDNLETENKQKNEEIEVLIADKNELLKEKIELTQRLVEERAVKSIYEEERNSLVSEKAAFEMKLLNQLAATENLMESRECLTQQLVEEKSAKELAEKEKENLLLEKQLIEEKIMEVESNKEEMSREIDDLIEKHSLLDQQCMKEREANEILSAQKLELLQTLTEELATKEEIIKENEFLLGQVECLKRDLLEQKTIQEVLISEKETLLVEKEGLVKTLGVEKSAHDEIETEKDQLITKLCELNESYISKAGTAQAELEKVTQSANTLQTNLKQQEELNSQLTASLTAGLDKVIQGLKREGIANEFVEKITQSDDTVNQASDKCETLIKIANTLTTELVMRQNLVKALEHGNSSLAELREVLKLKENQLFDLQTEIKRLQQIVNENKIELSKRTETYNTTVENKTREIQTLTKENQALTNDLNDVKLQLEVKVHSLKEKLIDNENLTDKLKMTYECQIDNLNVMITKLSNYLKDKTSEYDAVRKEKEKLMQTLEEKAQAIKALEEEVKVEVQNKQKLIKDFDAERQILKNMVTVTESIMEDQKVALNNVISEHVRTNEALQEEKETITKTLEKEKENFKVKLEEKDKALEMSLKEMAEVKTDKDRIEKQLKEVIENEIKNLQVKVEEKESAYESLVKEVGVLISADGASLNKESFVAEVRKMKDNLQSKIVENKKIREETKELQDLVRKCKDDIVMLEKRNEALKGEGNMTEQQLRREIVELQNTLQAQTATNKDLELTLKEKNDNIKEFNEKLNLLHEQIHVLIQDKNTLEEEKKSVADNNKELENSMKMLCQQYGEENTKLNDEKQNLLKTVENNKTVISYLEALVKELQQKNKQLSEDIQNDKQNLVSKCDILQQYHDKAEEQLEERQKEINILQKEINTLKTKVQQCEEESKAKDAILSKISKEKDAVITSVTKELDELKAAKEMFDQEIQEKTKTINELKQNLDEINTQREALHILRKENEELIKAVGMRETFAAAQTQEKTSSHKHSGHADRELRDLQHQKQLYTEQIAVYKEKQRVEVGALEAELARARARLADTSRAYEQHVRALTAELWAVGEKFLAQRDHAAAARRAARSASLMSLQHVHSSGLVPFQEEVDRPSDSHSLRSLPVNHGAKRDDRDRTLHMSDEEGEVFDNRWLKELAATPRRASYAPGPRDPAAPGPQDHVPPGQRLSELRWRNSLCPPHLKSSYPAETQFAQAVDEEDIKCLGAAGAAGGKLQRKEVGITAYKKPGPPTPSKQAGRLSATDSELRESLRVEAEPQPSRKTSTPSRIRSLFRSSRNDTAEGTPRSRRLSNIFRKK